MADHTHDQLIALTRLAVAESKLMLAFREEAGDRAAELTSLDQHLMSRSRAALARSRTHLDEPSPARVPLSATHERQELAHLRQANSHIADARLRIRRQRHLVAELSGISGHQTDLAETLLATMLNTLQAMEGHRKFIRHRLGAA